MSAETLARVLVQAAGAYVALGAAFAVAFLWRGVERVDPSARGSSRGFRLIVLPGVIALWPLLARRWLSGGGAPPVERNAHRRAAERSATP
jgi:hypothetical protein